jgi:hypothetical protein
VRALTPDFFGSILSSMNEPVHDAANDGYIYTRRRKDGGTFKVWISGTAKAEATSPVESIFEKYFASRPEPEAGETIHIDDRHFRGFFPP